MNVPIDYIQVVQSNEIISSCISFNNKDNSAIIISPRAHHHWNERQPDIASTYHWLSKVSKVTVLSWFYIVPFFHHLEHTHKYCSIINMGTSLQQHACALGCALTPIFQFFFLATLYWTYCWAFLIIDLLPI